MHKFSLGMIFGALLAGGCFVLYPRIFGNTHTYYVARVISHHAKELENSETTLLVYNQGKRGHVREIICLFPPGKRLPGGPYPRFSGIPIEDVKLPEEPLFKIKVGEVGQEYMFNETGFFCESM